MLKTLSIDNARAAAVFATPRQRQILLSLIPEERSLSQLSRQTGLALNLLTHHVRKFLQLGLVCRTRVEARRGAPIQYYRAVAQSFFVPAERMKGTPGAGLGPQMQRLLAQSLAQNVEGARYSHDGKAPRMMLVRDAHRSAASLELWLELRLSEADARALGKELRAVFHRFEARSHKLRRPYLLHAALAPRG